MAVMTRPLCFVVMPYRPTLDSDGQLIDFKAVYDRLIVPAVEEAGMAPLRADEELYGGFFHKTMFERLVVCEFAVADLSTGNPNVYYELGVRHGLRPYSTVLIFREGWRLPLDLAPGAALEYPVSPDGQPQAVAETKAKLVARLVHARDATTDSPVYQLVTGLSVPEVDHERIDSFRVHADHDELLRRQLDEAAHAGIEKVRQFEEGMGRLADLDLSTVLILIATYRSISAWSEIVRLVRAASRPVARLPLVREQYAMALNRCGEDAEAERVLRGLLEKRPSSETYGMLGRVYKDRWLRATSKAQARGLLRRAIDAYLDGFEADWRDPYPGVNAVTLMWLAEPPDERFRSMLPVVRYAAERRLDRTAREPDFWDHATDLGLSVLEGDRDRAFHALGCALAVVRDRFEPETTAQGLARVAEAAAHRGQDAGWIRDIVEELEAAEPV